MCAFEVSRREFTRAEFHQLTWSTPAKQIVELLGCSSRTFQEACRQYEIEKPYAGYWVKRSRNPDLEVHPLTELEDADKQVLTFFQHPVFETTLGEPPPESLFDLEVQQVLIKLKDMGPIQVRERLQNPHPITAETKKELENRYKERWTYMRRDFRYPREPGIFAVDVSPDLLNRAMLVLDSFIKACEQIGGQIKTELDRYKRSFITFLYIDGEKVREIRLREKRNQVQKLNEGWERKWSKYRTELEPSGLLQFDGGSSSWKPSLLIDKKKYKIEDKLADLIYGLVLELGKRRLRLKRERELEDRKAEERRRLQALEAEEKRRREDLAARQQEERDRIDDLVFHAEQWKKSELIREYLNALETQLEATGYKSESNETANDYLRWAYDQADRMDPFVESPSSILDVSPTTTQLERKPVRPK